MNEELFTKERFFKVQEDLYKVLEKIETECLDEKRPFNEKINEINQKYKKRIRKVYTILNSVLKQYNICAECHGTGRLFDIECPDCRGSGNNE